MTTHQNLVDELEAEVANWKGNDDLLLRAAQRIRELEAALKPFAQAVDDADEEHVRDGAAVWESAMAVCVKFGDFRSARQALNPEGK